MLLGTDIQRNNTPDGVLPANWRGLLVAEWPWLGDGLWIFHDPLVSHGGHQQQKARANQPERTD